MADASTLIRYRKGEKRPLYGTATAPTGSTHTISGTSTFTLYDRTGAAVTNLSGINVTGQDAGAVLAADAWYLLDTDTPVDLQPGFYTWRFEIAATGSDSLARIFEPTGALQILPANS